LARKLETQREILVKNILSLVDRRDLYKKYVSDRSYEEKRNVRNVEKT